MLEIVKGTIPVAGRSADSGADTAGVVTQSAFDGYKAEQKRELAVLEQEIGGGGFTICSLDFTTLEDSISYCGRHSPPGSYDCKVGLVILMGSITDTVVSHDMVVGQMLLGTKTHIFPKQLKVVSSFPAAYPVPGRRVDFCTLIMPPTNHRM